MYWFLNQAVYVSPMAIDEGNPEGEGFN